MRFSILLIIFCFGCSTSKVTIINDDYNLKENTLYFCMGQKNCFSCIQKFNFLKDSLAKYNSASKLYLLAEFNDYHDQLIEEQIKKIEKELGFKFDGYIIDVVQFDGPFSNSCGFLCKNNLIHFPALIYYKDKIEIVPFDLLFNAGIELDREYVLDLLKG
jgi:hypothetical protein